VRRTTPPSGEYARIVFFAPAEARAEIEAWFPGETLRPQRGGDLGEKMAAAFEEAFASGARRAVLIGSDVPWVTRETVVEAFRSLEDHDLVLGPARDGGYYLVALERQRPELFEGIAWSTPSVLASTVERAGILGLTVRLLDPLRDIDTLQDLRDEWPRLKPLLAGGRLTEAVARALGGD
jgi:rSAM/selenodomain-associated transferase 1